MKIARNILYRFPKTNDPFDLCVVLVNNTTYLCVKTGSRWRYFEFSDKQEFKAGTLAQPISSHTHASAAQGGQLDWDNIFSDAVHSHASNAEGGTLDWDNVWADAVHSHQSDAEGATLDHGAALTGLSDDDHTQYVLANGTRDIDYSSGDFQVGNVSGGSYTQFEADGTVEFVGDAIVYDDLQVSISNVKLPASSAPDYEYYAFGVGGGVTFPVLAFGLNEYIYFDVQTTHSMKLNTILDNHIHFTLPDTTDIGDKFKFQLDVIAAGIGGQWAVPTGSPFSGEHTIVANDDTYHRLLEIADIPASNTTVSSIYKCKLTRIAATANEYAGDVYITFTDCHYQKDTVGSRSETVK